MAGKLERQSGRSIEKRLAKELGGWLKEGKEYNEVLGLDFREMSPSILQFNIPNFDLLAL